MKKMISKADLLYNPVCKQTLRQIKLFPVVCFFASSSRVQSYISSYIICEQVVVLKDRVSIDFCCEFEGALAPGYSFDGIEEDRTNIAQIV